MTTAPRPAFRIVGWHVALAMTGFFGVIVAVDTTFVVAAYRTFPGQVSVTPYEDGLAFNRAAARRRAQAALGWQATAAVVGDSVVVEIRDRPGAPVTGLRMTGMLSRPATETGRLTLAFVETAPGRYQAPVTAGLGTWDLTFAAMKAPSEAFEGERRLTWP